jgi:hypothetical protein
MEFAAAGHPRLFPLISRTKNSEGELVFPAQILGFHTNLAVR